MAKYRVKHGTPVPVNIGDEVVVTVRGNKVAGKIIGTGVITVTAQLENGEVVNPFDCDVMRADLQGDKSC